MFMSRAEGELNHHPTVSLRVRTRTRISGCSHVVRFVILLYSLVCLYFVVQLNYLYKKLQIKW